MFGSLDAVLLSSSTIDVLLGGKGQDLVEGGKIVHVVAGAS